MLKTIKLLTLASCLTLTLQACHEDDDPDIAAAPKQLANINTAVYQRIRQNPEANMLFANTGATNVGDEPCDVKLHRMVYDTVDGTGKSVTSSGVFMLPHGDDARCQGPLPVVLYAHSTATEKDYDLSQFLSNPTNPAASESGLLLAAYASQGYAVIAPNYAGYADSSADYHPYLDRMQQPSEMINALDHIREYADILGAELSSELFVTGVSQGGYVSMATHQALEASGEKVTASVNISGPYAILDYIDTIVAGYVSGGATRYLPMYATALERSYDIYDNPADIYTDAYAGIAEGILPTIGGFASTSLPSALFGGEPPVGANPINIAGFGADHLLNDSFRTAYLTDAQANPNDPQQRMRAAVAKGDLRDWTPQAPMLMCGAGNDPVVYHSNSDNMAEYWADLVAAGFIVNLDLTDTPVGPFAGAMLAFQNAGLDIASIHGSTGVYCSLAALGYLSLIRSQQDSEQLEVTTN
ncbi:MAG: hypothetical protein R3F02_13010 [Thiolinea sp.]